jgi:hypothetical protein
MVALANDWRITEQRAHRFLSPARVVEQYRQILDAETEPASQSVSYLQMLTAIVSHAVDAPKGPPFRVSRGLAQFESFE